MKESFEEFIKRLMQQEEQTESYKVLHSPFDFETHKKTFVNYLEAVILEDGTIEYAVPSHQEKAIELYTKKYKFATEKEAWDSIPMEYSFDILTFLSSKLNLVFVWNEFYKGILNENQKKSLEKLKKFKLYLGKN